MVAPGGEKGELKTDLRTIMPKENALGIGGSSLNGEGLKEMYFNKWAFGLRINSRHSPEITVFMNQISHLFVFNVKTHQPRDDVG
ncbi:MAG: hypothetical protein IVW51_15225 [Thermaceae bacterium]|nr:hypothetical protein [Thermaceae bacterium]